MGMFSRCEKHGWTDERDTERGKGARQNEKYAGTNEM